MKFFDTGSHMRSDPDLVSLKRRPILHRSLPTYYTLVLSTFPEPFQDLRIRLNTGYGYLICFEHIRFLQL